MQTHNRKWQRDIYKEEVNQREKWQCLECVNELSAHLAVEHLDVALLSVLTTRYCIPKGWPTVRHAQL